MRERLLVSYFRYSGDTSGGGGGHVSHVDTVCELLRATGYTAGSKRPPGYPETLFSRVPVPKHAVNKVLLIIKISNVAWCMFKTSLETCLTFIADKIPILETE